MLTQLISYHLFPLPDATSLSADVTTLSHCVTFFFIFRSSKIHVSLTDVVSSISPLQCCLSSGRRHHAAASCHTYFSLSQYELATSTSSFGNVSSYRLSSRAETKALNPHHLRQPPSPDRLTLTFHCYKNIISILVTPPTIEPHLYFASFLTRAPHYRSSTCGYHFLLPLSHTHHPSIQ
jgi:hypothetical protein